MESGFPAVVTEVDVGFGLASLHWKLNGGVVNAVLLHVAGDVLAIEGDFFEIGSLEVHFVGARVDLEGELVDRSGLGAGIIFGGFGSGRCLFRDDEAAGDSAGGVGTESALDDGFVSLRLCVLAKFVF